MRACTTKPDDNDDDESRGIPGEVETGWGKLMAGRQLSCVGVLSLESNFKQFLLKVPGR